LAQWSPNSDRNTDTESDTRYVTTVLAYGFRFASERRCLLRCGVRQGVVCIILACTIVIAIRDYYRLDCKKSKQNDLFHDKINYIRLTAWKHIVNRNSSHTADRRRLRTDDGSCNLVATSSDIFCSRHIGINERHRTIPLDRNRVGQSVHLSYIQ
jgi:hypothetical protein